MMSTTASESIWDFRHHISPFKRNICLKSQIYLCCCLVHTNVMLYICCYVALIHKHRQLRFTIELFIIPRFTSAQFNENGTERVHAHINCT